MTMSETSEEMNESLKSLLAAANQRLQQMEMKIEHLEDQIEQTASLVLDGQAEFAPDHAVIFGNQSGRFWRLNLSSLSHCEWSGPELKIYFLTSNGEKIVRIKSAEDKPKSKRVWLKLIEEIEGGSEIISPYDLDGEKFLIEVLPTKD